MANTKIVTETTDGVGIITLNNPDALNAMNGQMRVDLTESIGRLDADPQVRVIIITGAGRGFCSGADLSRGAGSFVTPVADDAEYLDGGGMLVSQLIGSETPIIGAINGAAVGLGASMTLAMDWRIVSSAAQFGFVYARRGISPEGLSSLLLPRIVGLPTALDWMLTGRLVSADEAKTSGLANQVVDPDDLMKTALTIARSIRDSTSALSVAAIRRLLWDGNEVAAVHARESRIIRILSGAVDADEGVRAFIERRPAVFRGTTRSDLPAGWSQ